MNIALISARRDPFISPYDMDGGCVVLRNYVKELYEMGHSVCVFTRAEVESKYGNEKINYKARLQKQSGLGMVPINKRLYAYRLPYESSEGEFTDEISEIRESASFIRSLKPYIDVMVFDIYHYFHLMSVAGWYSNSWKIPHPKRTLFSPLLLTVNRTFEYPVQQRLELEKQVFTDCQNIVCQSENELEQIGKIYGVPKNHLLKIPLGVDRNIFYSKKKYDRANNSSRLILVCPNSIKKQKRTDEMIQITSYLKQKGHKITSVLVGQRIENDYYDSLIKLCEKLRLTYQILEGTVTGQQIRGNQKDILFIDGQKEEQLADVLRNSDLGIFPSRDEGFGLVVLDTIACGTPALCYKLKAYNEYLIDGENAILTDSSRNWEELAKNDESLLNTPNEIVRMSKTCANMSAGFSWQNVVGAQLRVYCQLADKYRRSATDKFYKVNWINLKSN